MVLAPPPHPKDALAIDTPDGRIGGRCFWWPVSEWSGVEFCQKFVGPDIDVGPKTTWTILRMS